MDYVFDSQGVGGINTFEAQIYAGGVVTPPVTPPTETNEKAMMSSKFNKLVALRGRSGSINDLINENTYWRALAGGSNKPLNDVKYAYLKGLGYAGTLTDMEKKYWENL